MTRQERVRLWEVINNYAHARGGDMGKVSSPIMDAVVDVEKTIKDLVKAEVNRVLGEALNSGNGVYKP